MKISMTFSHLSYFKKTKTKSVNGTTQPSSSDHLSAWRARARVCVPATSCADGLSQVGTLVSNLWGTSPTLCRPLLVGYLRKKRLVHTYTPYKGEGRRKEVSEREKRFPVLVYTRRARGSAAPAGWFLFSSFLIYRPRPRSQLSGHRTALHYLLPFFLYSHESVHKSAQPLLFQTALKLASELF